jgi:manganese/zinc/iron transport system substrate-binding protein
MYGLRNGTFLLPWVLLVAGLCCGCDRTKETTSRSSTNIVTTCGMVTDIVKIVAGDKADVTGLMGAGVDPHLYKPTRSDVKQLIAADLVFYSGLLLEGRMSDVFENVRGRGKPVYAVTEVINKSYLREPPEFKGHPDPHVWMDVAAWSQCVGAVAQGLSKFDPPNADFYKQNAEAYRAELKTLDDYVRKVIATIPQDQRILVTAHDAFGYFSRAYKIPVESVQGLTTESLPSIADINRLVDVLVERKVQAVFVEASVNPKNIQAVIAGANSRGWTVKIGGQLFSDAMGPADTYEGTYVGMMDHNATVIARALGGEAPEKGMNGKLRTAAEE